MRDDMLSEENTIIFFTPVRTPPNPRFVFDTQSFVLAPRSGDVRVTGLNLGTAAFRQSGFAGQCCID
jgi:hypothetical protein